MRETDLHAPVKAFLEGQGYSVKGEIGGCDALAIRGGEPPVIVELKAGFSLALVLQGGARQRVADNVYRAGAPVPGSRMRADHYVWFERPPGTPQGVYALTPKGRQALEEYADGVALL